MRIVKRDAVSFHWWGNSILLVEGLSRHYILDEVEAFIIEHLSITNAKKELVDLLAKETGLNINDISSIIDIFLYNFKNYLYLTSDKNSSFFISGQKGQFYPLEFHISLTNKCIQHCKHCYKAACSTGIFISFDVLSNFLDKMSPYVPYLCLSGGEPTLHPDFSKIMNMYSEKYYITVMTSGVSIHSFLDDIEKAKGGINVSLYSSNPNVHDDFTELAGSYNSIISTIYQARKRGISVSLSTYLLSCDLIELRKIATLAQSLDVNEVNVGKIAPVGRARTNNMSVIRDIPEQFECEVDHLLKEYTFSSSISFCSEARDTIIDNDIPYSHFKCYAGSLIWSIDEKGFINPCDVFPFKELTIGNIDNFNDHILKDRTAYIERIVEAPCFNFSSSRNTTCPFASEKTVQQMYRRLQ